MQDTFPKPVNGKHLADLRRAQGVPQKELAYAIGITRGRLYVWETDAALDPVRAARYERALRQLVDEKVAGTYVAAAS